MSEEPVSVLCVDDDPGVLDLTATCLERESSRLRVTTETTAAAGIDRIADGDVDCVVSDYEMPGTDGLAFLESVRSVRPDLPFVLFTGKGNEEVASEAVSAGVTDYLRKDGRDQYALLANRIENAVDRWRAERELARRSRAIDLVSDGVAILDDDGRYVEVNDAYAADYGLAPDDVEGRHWTALAPEGEATRLREEAFPAMEREGRWSGTSVGRREDGSTFTRRLTLVGLDVGHLRITAGPSTGDAAGEAAFDRTTDAVFALDTDWRFTYLNDRAEALLGQSAESLLGTVVWDAFPDAVGSQFDEEYRRAMETGEPTTFEAEYEPLDARFEVRAFPSETGLSVHFRDVTERHERERRLERRNDRLEAFADALSHDLRNPLTVARAEVQMAAESGDTDGLSTALDALDRVDEIVDDVLATARHGATLSERERCSLSSLAREAWRTVDTDGASLTVADDRALRADPAQLRRALENLFDNAVEHGSTSPRSQARGDAVEHGSTGSRTAEQSDDAVEHDSDSDDGESGAVRVEVGATDDGFYVADDGPGIPPDERDRVFERGYSEDDSQGIGLVVVRTVVRAHGWTVTASESEAGGARFDVEDVEDASEGTA